MGISQETRTFKTATKSQLQSSEKIYLFEFFFFFLEGIDLAIFLYVFGHHALNQNKVLFYDMYGNSFVFSNQRPYALPLHSP